MLTFATVVSCSHPDPTFRAPNKLSRDWSPSFAGVVKSPDLISYSSGPFHNFRMSQDLLGDGSIILLPTPGHAEGHLCVLVQMEAYQLLLAGDILYTLRHLAVDEVRAITVGKKMKQQQDSSEARLFDEAWHLMPGARPGYIPSSVKGHAGTVAEP